MIGLIDCSGNQQLLSLDLKLRRYFQSIEIDERIPNKEITMNILLLAGCGLTAGLASGFFGIGGGIVLIPLLTIILKLSQHQAQGTTLAILVLPVVLPAVIQYWRAGNIDWRLAAWVALGFVVGALASSTLVQQMPDIILKRAFGVLLLAVGVKYLFFK